MIAGPHVEPPSGSALKGVCPTGKPDALPDTSQRLASVKAECAGCPPNASCGNRKRRLRRHLMMAPGVIWSARNIRPSRLSSAGERFSRL